jgi:hypothetical protein
LAGGAAGLALLHGYLAQTDSGLKHHPDLGGRFLKQATDAVAENPASASLYGGLAGVGWTLAHLHRRIPSLDGADDLEEMDAALLDHLGQSPWADDYDLIGGLVGFGVYALERVGVPPLGGATTLPPKGGTPTPVACLERVLDRLAETAEHRAEGVTWWTNPAWLPAETRAKVPHGYYNLGLAHGVPGAIALLAQACAAIPHLALVRGGEKGKTAHELLEGAVAWLLAQQGHGGFAAWAEPGKGVDGPARLAWCYGDPGVAAALLGAARAVMEPAWERESLAIARRAAARPPEQAGVRDAGLCHGAAGLGHLFNRMHQATGEAQLGEAARFWFARTLQMRQPGRGIGGFEAWQPGEGGELTWAAEPGLLTGAAGIALALLAATTDFEPAWDRMLLLAIPPSVAG